MEVFRRILLAALCAGLLAGAFIAAVHQFTTVPLIHKAEVFEHAGEGAVGHQHETAWSPENGAERAAFTVAADLLAAIGFALLLAAAIALRGGEPGWREGLLWGIAGFAIFTLAPSVGLPPEVPGMAAAPLTDRQLWWLTTAAATGGGLVLLAFTRHPLYAVLALLLISLPQLYGAPESVEHAGGPPETLAHRFAVSVIVTSLLFWAVLGAASGGFYRLFASRREY